MLIIILKLGLISLLLIKHSKPMNHDIFENRSWNDDLKVKLVSKKFKKIRQLGSENENIFFKHYKLPNHNYNYNLIDIINIIKFKMNTNQFINLFAHLSSFLDNIHKINIIHRDIRPENIWFNYNKSDFGALDNNKFNDLLDSCIISNFEKSIKFNKDDDTVYLIYDNINYIPLNLFNNKTDLDKRKLKIDVYKKLDKFALGIIFYKLYFNIDMDDKFKKFDFDKIKTIQNNYIEKIKKKEDIEIHKIYELIEPIIKYYKFI